jgi:hypothetical protein
MPRKTLSDDAELEFLMNRREDLQIQIGLTREDQDADACQLTVMSDSPIERRSIKIRGYYIGTEGQYEAIKTARLGSSGRNSNPCGGRLFPSRPRLVCN